jgi:hypothetical protein
MWGRKSRIRNGAQMMKSPVEDLPQNTQQNESSAKEEEDL